MKFRIGDCVFVQNWLRDGGNIAVVIKQYGELSLATNLPGHLGSTLELYQVLFNHTNIKAEVYGYDMTLCKDPNSLLKEML